MAIQFSVLIVLHSCLVLVTTAEDYKCLPLVLRKACCWINETYAARNVIVFVSILINFLGAMINIVRFAGFCLSGTSLNLNPNLNPTPGSLAAVVRLRQVQQLQEPDVQRVGLRPRHLLLPGGTS